MDSFFGIGIAELFFIAIIALIVLGPERLPGAIREVAKWSRTIRNLSSELTSQFSEEMKAFDEINPNKILRDLTDDPAEKTDKAQAGKTAAATTAKTTTKTTAKPAAKPAVKPATSTASTTGAKTTPPKVPTPPMPKKRETRTGITEKKPDVEGQPEGDAAAAQSEPEKRILPSTESTTEAKDTPSAQAGAAAEVTGEESSAPAAPPVESETPGSDEQASSHKNRDDKIVVDAAQPHPTLSVNGKSTATDEEA